MLARRIIAVSADNALGAQLAALEVGGCVVEVHPELPGTEDLQDLALAVLHVDGDLAARVTALTARLPAACRVIAVLPRSELAVLVELMRATDRVAAMVIADPLDPAQLAAVATRLLTGDVFGLDKVLAPGAKLDTQVITSHAEKEPCITHVVELAEQAGLPGSAVAAIEQCLDEMLMNALYDAVVDVQGQRMFAAVPTRDRIHAPIDQPVVITAGFDGRQFGISVRDAFGSLAREAVVRVLHKCLHGAQQIDRRAGGAGVGLYLMVSSATSVWFNVIPDVATEALCTFSLVSPPPPLGQLGVLIEPRDVTGQLATSPARPPRRRPRRPHRRRRRPVVIAAALALALAGVAVVVAARRGSDPADERTAPIATIILDSQPTGATVAIDGSPAGGTPLTVTTLAPGATVSIVFRRAGYRDATARLEVPPAGQSTTHVQRLERSDEFVRVRFVSTPPGAQVISLAESAASTAASRTYTPAELYVEADQLQRFVLTMPGYVPLVIEPFTPARGTPELERGGALVAGSPLRIEATRGGRASVEDAPHCSDRELPTTCTLAPGTYVVGYTAPGGTRVTHRVTITDTEAVVKFGDD